VKQSLNERRYKNELNAGRVIRLFDLQNVAPVIAGCCHNDEYFVILKLLYHTMNLVQVQNARECVNNTLQEWCFGFYKILSTIVFLKTEAKFCDPDFRTDHILCTLDCTNTRFLDIYWIDFGLARFNISDGTGHIISELDEEDVEDRVESSVQMMLLFSLASMKKKIVIMSICSFKIVS